MLITQQAAPIVAQPQPKVQDASAATVDQILGLLKKAKAAQIGDIESQPSANGTISNANLIA